MADNNLQNRILQIARSLLNCPTAPYREQMVRKYIENFCAERHIPVRIDQMGNLIASYGRQYRNETLAFSAHMDHPGFIIEKDSINKKTTALFYGGVETDYFNNARIRVFTRGKEITGRITKINFDMKKFIKRAWLTLDGNVKKGDLAMWDLPAFKVASGILYSRACDDCLGCASLLALFDELTRNRVTQKVTGIFTVAEEAGLHGAKFVAMKRRINKHTAIISIETSSVLPGISLGDGVVVRVGDSHAVFNPAVTEFIRDTAKRIKTRDQSFFYQRKLMDAGACESSVYHDFGFTTGAVCIPLANYHNRNRRTKKIAPESVSIADLENMVKLLFALVQNSPRLKKFLKTAPPAYTACRRPLGEHFLW